MSTQLNRPQKNLPEDVANIMPMQGHVFEGKYRIVALIGAGGFARVYHARFEDVGRDVAIKILVPASADPGRMYGDELVQRFHREARAVSDLRSPNTITLHDFGRTGHGLLYMVFEYVNGTPLDRLIKQTGPMPAARAVHIIRQVLTSLREAHVVGMLHRDIKPANVMVFDYLDQRDQVKLLDFGIAKTWTHDAGGMPIQEDLTEDGTVMGTPRYMSPEQIVGQRLTPQSDIYSTGLLLFEMLVGRPAAPQTEKSEVVRQHLSPEAFALPPNAMVPAGLREVVARMTAKQIAQRYRSVDEVLAALDAAQRQDAVEMADTQASTVAASVTQPSAPYGQPAHGFQPGFGAAPPPQQGWTGGVPTAQNATPQGWGPQTPPATTVASGPMAVGPAQSSGPIAKPERTHIQIRATPQSLEVDVPMKPTKRALIVCAVGFLFFSVAWIAGGIIFMLLTGALFAWGLSLVFVTRQLRITPQEGYELTEGVFTMQRHKRGPTPSVMRFEARGQDADDNTTLKMVTHEGEFTIADAFTEAEGKWVAQEGNAWLAHLRAMHPNPVH